MYGKYMLQCVPGLSSGGGGGDKATTPSAHSTMIVQQWNAVLCKVKEFPSIQPSLYFYKM